MPQRILVLGDSGYIGQHLVQALSQQGHQVLAAARRIERLEKQQLANVSCHKVDLNWPDNLTPLLVGVDTVYYNDSHVPRFVPLLSLVINAWSKAGLRVEYL